MHVALFSPAWPLGTYANGIVTYATWLRAGLLAEGHRVSIVSPQVDSAVEERDVHPVVVSRAERIANLLTPKASSFFRFGKTIAAALQHVDAAVPVDVIEMEESFGFVAQVARSTGLPTVVKLHGPAFLTLPEDDLKTPFGQEKVRREREALASLPAVMAPSHFTLSETLAWLGRSPPIAEHVVNPIALAADAPLWDLTACERDTLLFVGRFDALKGGDLVVRAFQRLLVARPHLRLIFVGPDSGIARADGPPWHLRDFITALGGDRLAERVSIRGFVPPAEVNRLRAHALLTIVPSRRESQGYAALEAMLQGCPVVCTDTSGLGEIVAHERTGLKARPEDDADLAAQIGRIVDDPDFGEALGRRARAYALEHHSSATVVRQTLDVYRRAIALHGKRRR